MSTQLDGLHTTLIAVIAILITYIAFTGSTDNNDNNNTNNNNNNNTNKDDIDTKPSCNLLPPSQMLDFLLIIGKLKQEKRTGWVNHKIPGAESVADHMYRMAIMALFIRDGNVNSYKAARVALLHDAAEALVGDITPPESSGVSVEDKHALEQKAFNDIATTLINNNINNDNTKRMALATEFGDLYEQYNSRTTEEGRFCKELDKLEMIIQAYEYESLFNDKDLTTFYNSGKKGIKHPYLLQLQDELLKRREVLLNNRNTTQI